MADHTEAVTDSSDTPSPVPVPVPVPQSRTLAGSSTVESPLTRPLSASTLETRVDDIESVSVMAQESPPRDHIALALSPLNSRRIPGDDGMHELRLRIHAINAQDISPAEKARLMHDILLEGYHASKQVPRARRPSESHLVPDVALSQSPSSPTSRSLKFWNHLGEAASVDKFVVSEEDKIPTFVPIKPPKRHGSDASTVAVEAVPENEEQEEQRLGCQHYERNVKLQCFTCKKWYTCRFCHDSNEDHNLVRTETRNMLCMICATPQKASDVCINCGEIAANYYCNICKLWENRQSKPIYHCNECGICRRGMGLGKDFFHCKVRILKSLKL